MKAMIDILKRDRIILFLILLSFALTEYYRNIKVFTIAGVLLFVWSFIAKFDLMRQYTWRVGFIVCMFLFYFLFGITGFNIQFFVHHLVPTCTLYMIGRAVVLKNRNETYYVGLLLVVAFCCGIYDIVITIIDISENSLINIEAIAYEYQDRDNWVPTSLRASEMSPLISCIVLLLVSSKNSKVNHLRWLGGGLAVVALISALHFVSRTAFVVAVLCLLEGVVYKLFHKQKSILWLVIIIGSVVLFLNSSFWELIQYKNEITDVATGNGRMESLNLWWNRVITHPFGVPGWQNNARPFAHNFWLDFAKIAGWIPALFLIFLSLLNMKDVLIIYKNKYISSYVKLLVVSMLSAFMLAYSVEPIFEGTKNGLYCYFFFCGIVSAMAQIKHPLNLS